MLNHYIYSGFLVDNVELDLVLLSTLMIYLLIDIVKPFTFKVLIDIVGRISTMFVTAFYSLHLFAVSFFFPLSLPSLVFIEHFT